MPSEFTRMRNPATGREAEIPTGAVEGQTDRGWQTVSGSRTWTQAQHEAAQDRLRAAAGEHLATGAAIEDVTADATPSAPKPAPKVPKQKNSTAGEPGDNAEKE